MSRRKRLWQYYYSKSVFTPSSVPGLVLWLEADKGITVSMSPVTAAGTTPPTVTLSGTPSTSQTSGTTPYVEIDITTGGALGTALYQVNLNGTVILSGQTTAASAPLTGTGLTAAFSAGTYATNNVYTANINAAAWADQSGLLNNFLQATATLQPTYVGGAARPHLYFGSNNIYLVNSTLALNQPCEVFVAAQLTSVSGAVKVLTSFSSTGNINSFYTNGGNPSTLTQYANAAAVNGVVLTANADFVTDGFFNGASSQQILNGGAPVTGGNPGTTNGTGGSIGYEPGGASWIGRVYGVLTYNQAVSVANRALLNAFMATVP